MIQSGLYSFNKHIFWVTLINKVQETFDTLTNKDKIDHELYCGNIILIFYLCKNQLLSLSIISHIYNIIYNLIEDNEVIINILFSIIENIPLDKKYNSCILINTKRILLKNIPFRLTFKLEELISKIENISKNISNNKNNDNIEYEKNIETMLNNYVINKSIKELEVTISNIKSFRKSYFFKVFILNIIKKDISTKDLLVLSTFIYNRKYRPNNYRNIINQISKIIKKKNNTEYNRRLSIIINKKS